MSSDAIATRGLNRRFGSLTALKSLDMNVARGSFCGLLGPSGAGKTTTIKMLLGLLKPNSGEGTVAGTPLGAIDHRFFQRVSYLADRPALPGSMRVADYLSYLRPFYERWDTALEQELIRLVDLPVKPKIKTLSKGNQLKAGLVSRLACRPEVLVLDEPFSGIDVAARDQLIESLLKQSSMGSLTVLISSHDLDEIERLVDQVVMLRNGEQCLNESTDRLLDRFRQITITGDPAMPDPLTQQGWLTRELNGRTFGGVFTEYRSHETEKALGENFLRVDDINVAPMSLRSVIASMSSAPTQQVSS